MNPHLINHEEEKQKIMRLFATERYKQFSHQTRPFLTLFLAMLLIALGWFQILSFVIVAWILALFVFDNIILTPVMSFICAANHLTNGRKEFKSRVMLVLIPLALVVGAGLGFFVLLQIPAVVSVFANYITLTGCSPFLISMGTIGGGVFSHSTHKIPPFWGMFLGGCIASLLPIPIPIAFEVVYFSAVGLGFFSTILVKQVLRCFYQLYYGHSNADGYNMAKNPTEMDHFIQQQAQKFGVEPALLLKLTEYCRLKIATIKQNASLWSEYTSERRTISNSYKDIYFGLMNPKLSSERIVEIKQLIAKSNQFPHQEVSPDIEKKLSSIFRLGAFFDPNLADRTLAHQFLIKDNGNIDSSLLSPFEVQISI